MTTEPSDIKQFLDDFRATIETSASRLMNLSPEGILPHRPPDKWTPKEILGHLIDSAGNNHSRFVRAQFTDDLVFPGYEQDKWVRVQRYNDEPWSELVQLWTCYNRHIIHIVSVMPEQTLKKPRTEHNLDQIAWKTVDRSQPTTLEYFVRDYAGHLRHHLAQILGKDTLLT